jgi:hypothetical protein
MSLYGMHSFFMSLMKSKGLEPKILRFLMGLSAALMGKTIRLLTAPSTSPIMPMATLSRIIIMMSGTEHSCSSLGRLSIHAGLSSMKTCAIVGCGG